MAVYGRELGFSVSVAEALGDGEAKFSSTGVRAALREGRPQDAAAILGRPFAIEGVVEHGRKQTAKIRLDALGASGQVFEPA